MVRERVVAMSDMPHTRPSLVENFALNIVLFSTDRPVTRRIWVNGGCASARFEVAARGVDVPEPGDTKSSGAYVEMYFVIRYTDVSGSEGASGSESLDIPMFWSTGLRARNFCRYLPSRRPNTAAPEPKSAPASSGAMRNEPSG